MEFTTILKWSVKQTTLSAQAGDLITEGLYLDALNDAIQKKTLAFLQTLVL